MTPHHETGPELPRQGDGGNAAAGQKLHPRRWGRLFIIVLVLLGLVGGVWFYRYRATPLPEVPLINLDEIDPEVAEAVTRARAAVVKAPNSVKTWRTLAMVLHTHGFLDEALTCYTATSLLDKENPLWPYLQGDILKYRRQPEAALPFFERAAALSPPNSLARLRRADLFQELGRLEESAKEYRKVLTADAGNIHAHLGLGQVCFAQHQYEQALAYLQKAENSPHARKRACALSAAAYQRLGNSEAADRERGRLEKLPMDSSWPDEATNAVSAHSVGLGVFMLKASLMLNSDMRPDQLRRLLLEAVKRYPQSDKLWLFLGKALGDTNDPAGAERALAKCIELAPGNAMPWFTLGTLRQAQGQTKGAAEAFRKAVELRPTDAIAHFELGRCLQEQGDKTGAADAFRQAIRFRPDMIEAHQRLTALSGKS